MKPLLAAIALLGAFSRPGLTQVTVLHLQVIEGEGAVNVPGARIAHPLVVEVTDEIGKPVEGAAVSFHLPEDGASGAFGNGLRTDVTITDSRGRAYSRALELNRTPGRLAIRIVASKEQARAGEISFQYIADSKNSTASAGAPKSGTSLLRGPLKWVIIAVLAGGAATAGAMVAGRSGTAAPAEAAPATTTSGATVTIGNPVITVGKP